MPFKILPYAISAAVVAAAAAMSRADEAGTIVLTNGAIRAEILPAWAGRLMFFGRPGGANLLWFGEISSPEPAGSGRWARIALPESDAARKVSADGDALAVRLPDGDGWLLMEQTAPARCLSAFATPGRAMVYASPVGFRPSAYAELEFAAYGPDAEHTVRFSLPRELPGASVTAPAAASGPPATATILGTAVPGRGGAVFTVPPQSRTVWANIEWVTAGGQTNLAFRHVHLIGDGRERRYFFDGAAPVRWNANYPAPDIAEKWNGDITSFRVLNDKTQEEIPIRDLRIVTGNPGLPPELILSYAKAPMQLDRAGRPVDVEVGVFNAGTLAATNVNVRVEGLPEGVRIADPDRALRLCDLGGGDSVLHRVAVIADAPREFTARLVFSGGNAPEAVAEVPVKIGPSLGLPQGTDRGLSLSDPSLNPNKPT